MSAYFLYYLFRQSVYYCVWYAISNQSSSEFMVYTGNMNFVGLAGIISMEILIYAYRNTLQILW